jgi:GNAT superfamily N-acetyltransferase
MSATAPTGEIILREARAGDMSWVVERNGHVYTQEFGWNWGIEGVVCEVVGGFIRDFDPAKERCWIAERDGRRVGCVALVRESDDTARLRLLLVDAAGRGAGLGERLVDACIAFARERGYREIVLWTHADLLAARKLYARAGFELTESVEEETFGKTGVNETWRLGL